MRGLLKCVKSLFFPFFFCFFGKMCLELKLSIETLYFLHKLGFIVYACFPGACELAALGSAHACEGKRMASRELLVYLWMGNLFALAAC